MMVTRTYINRALWRSWKGTSFDGSEYPWTFFFDVFAFLPPSSQIKADEKIYNI